MASREILSLDTATPQIVAPQTGDTYSAPRAVAISPEPLTGTSATTSLDIAQTWNTTGTPTAVKLNVTDTASNANSLLMDLQVGGTSRFKVAKTGYITLPLGSSNTTPTIIDATSSTSGLNNRATGFWTIINGGNAVLDLGSDNGANNFVRLNSAMEPSWTPTSTNAVAVADTKLFRDAANTLAQRNATNAQTFRVYNTYTDASNYERGFIRYVSNQLEIGHEAAGTGNGDRLIVIQRPNAGTVLDIKGSTTVAARIGTGVSGFGVAIGVGSNGTNPDVFVYRRATAVASLTGNATGTTGAALEFIEQTAPAAPAANSVYLYAEDNGAGKTRLMARFATGAAQQVAIEP